MEEMTDNNNEIISSIKLIPQILLAYNIPLKVEINEQDALDIKSFDQYCLLFTTKDKEPFKVHLSIKEEEYNKEMQMKYWCSFLIALFVIERKSNKSILTISQMKYLSHIILELYLKNLLYHKDVLILLKFLIALGLTKFNSPIKREVILSSIKAVQFTIIIIYTVFNGKLSAEEQDIISSFVNYFDEYVLSYEYNSTLFYSIEEIKLIMNMISNQGFITVSNKKVVDSLTDLLSKVFNKKFDNKILNCLVEHMKSVLINFHKKTLPDLIQGMNKGNSIIELIKKMNSNDVIIGKMIQKGFFFTNSPKSGMYLTVPPHKEFSLMFSFNTHHPYLDASAQTLISFYNKKNKQQDNENILFLIGIKNGVLMIIVNKEKKSFDIPVKTNKTYCILLTYSKKFTLYCNEVSSSITADLKWKEDSKCCIGYQEMNNQTINHFAGKLGSIIFFDVVFKDTTIKMLQSLETEYDKILLSKYDHSSIEKYDAFHPRLLSLSEINQQTSSSIANLIKWSITPEAFMLYQISDKISYKYNIYDSFNHDSGKANKHYRRVNLLYPFSPEFFIFENKITIVEFIKLDGMQFICLHLEYYYQLVQLLPNFIEEDRKRVILIM